MAFRRSIRLPAQLWYSNTSELTHNGSGLIARVGYGGHGGNSTLRIFGTCDWTPILGHRIVSATLRMVSTDASQEGIGSSPTFYAHFVLYSDADISVVNWSIYKTATNWNAAGATTAGTDYSALPIGTGTLVAGNHTTTTLDMTDMALAIAGGRFGVNYMWTLRKADDSGGGAVAGVVEFYAHLANASILGGTSIPPEFNPYVEVVVEDGAMTDVGRTRPFTFDANASAAALVTTMDSVGGSIDSTGMVFMGRTGKTITHIHTDIQTLTGAPVLDIRLETVTNNLPSGSLATANSNAAYSPTGTGGVWHALTAGHVVTTDQVLAAVADMTTADGSNSVAMVQSLGPATSVVMMPFLVTRNNSTTWVATGIRYPSLNVRYSDGVVQYGPYSVATGAALAVNTGTTPDEVGTYYVPATHSYCVAIDAMVNAAAGANFTICLYEGTTLRASKTYLAASLRATGAAGQVRCMLDDPVRLTAGQPYRFTILPTTANSVTIIQQTYSDASLLYAGYGSVQGTSRSDAGAFTESATTINPIGPVLNEVIPSPPRGRGR